MQRIRFSVKISVNRIRQFVTILSVNKTMDMALTEAFFTFPVICRRMDAFSVLSFWAGHVCDGLFFSEKRGKRIMPNEILLILTVILYYGGVLIFYRLFGLKGLYVWTAFATITANIEVLILIEAFGMEQTLGNVMFASSFLVTDIISENFGKKEANHAVNLGIAVLFSFVIVSQTWLLFTPSANDWAFASMQTIFSNTPRLMIASLAVYAVSQRLDVWLYHKWWNFTSEKSGDSKAFLWVRNNGSTLISQLVNAVLYNLAAFAGTYDIKTLLNIIIATYVIYIFTSLLDTPAVYLSRKIGRHAP